jgi:outer membrane autotransporter protein
VGQQLRRAAETSADAQAHSALWLDAQGRHARWSGDEAASGFTTNGSQFTLGADVYRRGTTRLGIGFSHASTRIGADQGSAGLDENFAFAYGQRSAGRFVVDALAAYGRSHADTQRADPTGLSATALASASKGRSALLAAGVRAPWKVDGATVAPFGRITVQNVTRDAATEGAGSPAALGLDRFSATGTRLVAGLSGTSVQADPLQAPATWNYSVGLGFDAGALSRPTVQASLAGVATRISAPHVGRGFLQVDASGTMRVRPNAYVYYGVTGEARSGAVGVGVNAGLRVAF